MNPIIKHEKVKITILVIEDSLTQAEEIRYFLESYDYTVAVANDGQEAFEWLQNSEVNPDVIVSDVVMPRMDGYEFCKAIRTDEKFKNIPVILLTSLSQPHDIIKSIEAGANKFLTKPFDHKRLPEVIDELYINTQRRSVERMEMGIRLMFGGNDFLITADKVQILDLLLSSYEDSYYKNIQLQEARSDLERLNSQLELKVQERTEELVQSELEIKSLIEHSPVAMLVDEGFGELEQVLLVNKKFIELFGYTQHDIPNIAHWWPLAYPDENYRNTMISQWDEYMKAIGSGKKDVEGVEALIVCKDGSKRFTRVSLATTGKRNIITLEDFTVLKEAAIKLKESLLGTVRAISDIVEMRDPYTAGHQKRVEALACAIAGEMGLDSKQREGLQLAARIHDVGKIQIPAEILSKPTKLSDIEFLMIKTHAEAGYEIIKDVDFPWEIATIIRQHHEKLDGSGYPHGLHGDEILLEARILTVADIVEAMASHRPYRAALGIDTALAEIQKESGTKLDSAVVDACIRLFKEERFSFSQG